MERCAGGKSGRGLHLLEANPDLRLRVLGARCPAVPVPHAGKDEAVAGNDGAPVFARIIRWIRGLVQHDRRVRVGLQHPRRLRHGVARPKNAAAGLESRQLRGAGGGHGSRRAALRRAGCAHGQRGGGCIAQRQRCSADLILFGDAKSRKSTEARLLFAQREFEAKLFVEQTTVAPCSEARRGLGRRLGLLAQPLQRLREAWKLVRTLRLCADRLVEPMGVRPDQDPPLPLPVALGQ